LCGTPKRIYFFGGGDFGVSGTKFDGAGGFFGVFCGV